MYGCRTSAFPRPVFSVVLGPLMAIFLLRLVNLSTPKDGEKGNLITQYPGCGYVQGIPGRDV
ncbi:hypothetical protein EGR_11317 [Echinococcus granulosus]|uniref:Uncharacterized protein n=1 Tax=Echinococcus granulosus TaxID=6210 RepID=W6U670_ECHGR|nr:hypothetical protein EGR_11317 [Echinococcus granulosus]EUB53832.1 hypothetical protein EGR_11317 [Echinococcus granulosus]